MHGRAEIERRRRAREQREAEEAAKRAELERKVRPHFY